MDVLWMQNFLGLAQCDAQPCSSNAPSNCAPLHYDDYDGDTDALFEFSCPFCYLEYDIGSLCSHLEEEHSAESKLAICPVCAVKAGHDIVGHITNQHGHLFKRRRRARKSSISSSASLSLDPLLTNLLTGLSVSELETAPSIANKEASINSLSMDQKNTSCQAWQYCYLTSQEFVIVLEPPMYGSIILRRRQVERDLYSRWFYPRYSGKIDCELRNLLVSGCRVLPVSKEQSATILDFLPCMIS